MTGAGAYVAAEDFKKLLTRHGLNLIAERVEDEKTVVQLLDYAVDYAQGYLFGEPRAVREDSLKPISALEPAAIIPFKKRANARGARKPADHRDAALTRRAGRHTAWLSCLCPA
ncbi:MAG: hypothetical protein RJB58_1587 [Pseudomonadota bacterium]